MDAARREQILRAYIHHAQRFEEIASSRRQTVGLLPEGDNVASSRREIVSVPQPRPGCPSGREREVLMLVALGLSNHEIGSRLDITVETVKTHVQHILRRLGARNRAHAVFLACDRGLLVSAERPPSHP